MRVLFMGTPDFAVYSLEALCNAGYEIVGVVTQPDRPKGRGREMSSPPVKQAALARGLPVWQPERIRNEQVLDELALLRPDVAITAAYGQLLPKRLLEMPKTECLNVHASLLPAYRGAAPIQRAILAGETETGVTLMRMVRKLDAGPMFAKVRVPIEPDDTFGSLHDKLAIAGAQLLIETLPSIVGGSLAAVPQDETTVSYASLLTREDEAIDWSKSQVAIVNQVRALSPWPGAFTLWNGATLKVWAVEAAGLDALTLQAQPGQIVEVSDRGVRVATGEGSVVLTVVQLAGKKRIDGASFARGQRLPIGAQLGEGTGR